MKLEGSLPFVDVSLNVFGVNCGPPIEACLFRRQTRVFDQQRFTNSVDPSHRVVKAITGIISMTWDPAGPAAGSRAPRGF